MIDNVLCYSKTIVFNLYAIKSRRSEITEKTAWHFDKNVFYEDLCFIMVFKVVALEFYKEQKRHSNILYTYNIIFRTQRRSCSPLIAPQFFAPPPATSSLAGFNRRYKPRGVTSIVCLK